MPAGAAPAPRTPFEGRHRTTSNPKGHSVYNAVNQRSGCGGRFDRLHPHSGRTDFGNGPYSGQGGDSRGGRSAAAVMALAAAGMLILTGSLELAQPSSDGSDPLRMHPIVGAKEFASEG